jgi:N-acetylglutamate synthase-like GNAT family acetyltransferase
MQIRPATVSDLDHLIDLDGTIESSRYLHVERAGEGLAMSWRVEERPLREKRVDANAVEDDRRFALRQVLAGIEEGIAVAVDHDGVLTGLAAARLNAQRQTLELIDLRVDYEYRGQGLGSALLYQVINRARETGMRAVTAITLTNNLPGARFLSKSGFDLAGVDTHFASNHDLVKEAVALLWYAALD